MGACTRIRALTFATAAVLGCSTPSDPDVAYRPPGGWDQNGYWNSTFTRFVPPSSPRWPGPRLLDETFNANNHLSLSRRVSASACGASALVTIRGGRFENGLGIGTRIWLDQSQRWLAPGESVTYPATLHNDADWSIPVTITARRMQDLAVEGVDDIVSPTYDVTLRRDSDCVAERLGINQLGPVPVVATSTARFATSTSSYAYYKTYFSGQERVEAVPAKVMVNAGLLQPMPGEPDDFYETCTSRREIASSMILFNASYALSAMTWVDVVGSTTLDTGVQMTVPGQRVRIHMLVDGEPICHRRGFPGRRVAGLAPPETDEPDPTSIDVVHVDSTAYLAADQPVTIGHHAVQGTSTARVNVWLSTSVDADRYAYHTMKESKVRGAHLGSQTGMVSSWLQVVNVLSTPLAATATARARLIAVAVTPPPGSPDYFEAPADQTQAMNWCGNGYCWAGETAATCPVDCAPPSPPMGMDAGVMDAPMTDAPTMDAGVPMDAMPMDAMTMDAPTADAGTADAMGGSDAPIGPDAGM